MLPITIKNKKYFLSIIDDLNVILECNKYPTIEAKKNATVFDNANSKMKILFNK